MGKTVTLITPKLGPKPAKSSKAVKRSESVMSRFSMFFPSESEKLADMLVEEFKKNDQTNGLAMERMFRNQMKQSDKPEDATKKIKKKKSFKQLIMGTKQSNNVQLPVVAEKVEEATSDDVKDIEQLEMGDCQSSSPDVNAQNRKKRMKKRRQARKNFDEDSSSLSSNGQEQQQQQQQQQQQVIKQETPPAVESEAKLDS